MTCLKCQSTIESREQPTHGMHAACFAAEFDVEPTADFRDLFERTNESGPRGPDDLKFQRFNSSFFHGKYRKYSATLGDKNYILKVQQPECPELPAIEFACNRIARQLGIQIPDHHFILFNNQSLAFVSRNFMDQYAAATLDHIYKFLEPGDGFTCKVLARIIQKETGRLSEVWRFAELCLFDSLIGNNDRHGRNLAFVTRSAGIRILSPIYDNPSYIGIADEALLDADLQPRGAIFTDEVKEPLLRDYIHEFRRLELDGAVDRFKQRALARAAGVVETLRQSPSLSARRRNALIRLIEKRLQEFENE